MRIAFTICANNYLARAKIVADSFMQHHPGYDFYLFLVDKKEPAILYDTLSNWQVIDAAGVIPDLRDLAARFNIVELSTSIKPALFMHIFRDRQASSIIYLDPDTFIVERFSEVEALLDREDTTMVLTPHFCSPIDDGKFPSEIDFQPFGLFNLGFLGLRNCDESGRFLSWWHDRLMKYGYNRPNKSMFTDQLWVNYAPLFFEGVKILKHPGYNMANWNLYERKLSYQLGVIMVNEKYRLKFFHFSHYVFDDPKTISRYQTRYTLEERPDLSALFELYRRKMVENDHASFAAITGYYQSIYETTKAAEAKENRRLVKRIKRKLIALKKLIIKN